MNARFKAELAPFVGRQLIDVYDELKAIAKRHGYYLDPVDPDINTGSIDVEVKRLDVFLDDDSVITGFTTG